MSDRIDELVDTPEQALRFLDTVMHSDNEDMRRGAFNRVSIHIQQAATISREAEARALEAEAMCEWLAGLWAATDECPISIGGLDIEFECDDDPPCIPPIDEQRIARCWLAAARKAVIHGANS